MTNKLSIIIPVWNEEGNIELLVKRIAQSFPLSVERYEIIFIDDHSVDRTRNHIRSLKNKYPVLLYPKKGQKGKAQSLLEGFSYAQYDTIVMIDADLQYPPEAIPEMIEKIKKGADIVVANRRKVRTNIVRKVISRGFSFFFGRLMHGFDCDVQSGLKAFKKEVIERIHINPTPWAFDLEFLLKARDAGYAVDTVDIVFHKRQSGNAKINIFKASYEIGRSAIGLRFTPAEIIPFHPSLEKKKGVGFHYKGREFVSHTTLHHSETALYTLDRKQKVILSGLLTLLLVSFLVNWHTTLIVIIAVLTTLYFSDLLFNFFLIYRSFSKKPEIKISAKELKAQYDWPAYTIFCPLYKEWEVLPQFIAAMESLDYPKDKLQIILLLEEDDKETIQHARAYDLPKHFEIVIVPHSKPKTKPKAMNYGLLFAKGEYVVVYDAEDVPEQEQLKKAILAFKKVGKNTVCIQAKLNFYNPRQNVLTRMFTAEYSLWFDLVLTGLQSIFAPIPLGGTSNHFRVKDIKNLHGWDAFNVTEDCDLGMRLVKKGFHTAIVDSVTLEEANSDGMNWFWQRTRWIKGYIQTYLVHVRDPKSFLVHWKKPDFLTFQLIVGGKFFSMLINPFMWVITAIYFLFRAKAGVFIESFFPAPVMYMGVFCLIFGNFLYMYYYMIGCAKREYDDIIKYVYLIPLYWLAMSAAAWVALYKLIRQPHFWAKTKHGLHLQSQKAREQTYANIGSGFVDIGSAAYSNAIPLSS